MDESTIIAERLRRQHLLERASTDEEYLELARLMQPIAPPAYSKPGNPPVLEARVCFDDSVLTGKLRRDRRLVKGRFLSGNVGYVFSDQLATYAVAFLRPLAGLNRVQQTVLDVVQRAGPVTIHQIKEETGLLSRQIVPALHRLQKAFLVYEDQIDSDWERAWYDFETEWPDTDLSEGDSVSALSTVIRNYLQVQVFATSRHVADWSGLPLRKVEEALLLLAQDNSIRRVRVAPGTDGWLLGDAPDSSQVPRQVIVLSQADLLVRSYASDLKRRFPGREILKYLLIDGRLIGAVIGHWRIGPHDVEDIEVQLPEEEAAGRMTEVLEVVSRIYHPPHNHIRRYARRLL